MESKPSGPDAVTDSVKQVKEEITAGLTGYMGVGPPGADRNAYLVFLAASVLVSVGILLLLGFIYLWPLFKPYYSFISNKEEIGHLLRATGHWGPFVFIFLVGRSSPHHLLAGALGDRRGFSLRTALRGFLFHNRPDPRVSVGFSFGTPAGGDSTSTAFSIPRRCSDSIKS